MPADTYLFIDFENTLCDMAAHREQFAGVLCRLLSEEFGGQRDQWHSAIRHQLALSMGDYARKFTGDPLAGYNAWVDQERVRATTGIFTAMEVPLPTDEPVVKLAKRLQFDALTGCNSLLEGTESALKELFDQGVRTQLASAQESEYLLAALIGAGVESYTESKFGPDLVDCAKEGPEFYRRIFAACEIRPSQAIVVDDQAMCLDWAEEAGARVVQAALLPDSPEPEFPIVLRSFSDLPRLIRMGLT
jgi:FMN phosphatase YigB (HAD superfamily)